MEPVDENQNENVQRLTINVGGRVTQVFPDTLVKYPETLLGQFAKNSHKDRLVLKFCDFFDENRNEYIFDRSPIAFESVLNFYRTGEMHLPDSGCPMQWAQELRFWQIPMEWVAPCCARKISQQFLRNFNSPTKLANGDIGMTEFQSMSDTFSPQESLIETNEEILRKSIKPGCYGNFRNKTWQFVENPMSSKAAMVSKKKLFACFSLFFNF